MPEPDPAQVLSGLSEGMVRALTWHTHDGVVHCDVPAPTKAALVRKGVAEWVPGDDLCPRLTDLGIAVQALAKQAPERTDT